MPDANTLNHSKNIQHPAIKIIIPRNSFTYIAVFLICGTLSANIHSKELPGRRKLFYQGKELTIILTTSDNDAFSGLSPIKIGIYNDIKNTMVQGVRLPMVIGVYLCHLGFLLIIMAPFLAFSRYHDLSIIFSGLTSLLIGIYILKTSIIH